MADGNCTCGNCGYTGDLAYAKFSDVVVIALNNGTILYKDVEVYYCPECGDTKNDSSVE